MSKQVYKLLDTTRHRSIKCVTLLIVTSVDKSIDSLEGKYIFTEEFNMVPNKWITTIYKAFTMFNNKVYSFGDCNQCEPVEAGSQVHYHYQLSATINQICRTTKNKIH